MLKNLESRERELLERKSFLEDQLSKARNACENLLAQIHGHAGALEECQRVKALLQEQEKEQGNEKTS